MINKLLFIFLISLTLESCGTFGNNTNKGVPQDNPMVGSTQASDAEFPSEDQLTPAKNSNAQ